MTSLALSGALAVTAAVLTPSATAEVTADREGAAGRTAAIVPTYNLNYNSAADPRTCDPPDVAPEDPGFCLDLYKTDTVNAKKPLVVLIHGGGWIADASRRDPRLVRPAKDLANAGYVALIMDYPKAAERVPGISKRVPGTTMQEDAVEQTVAWADANQSTYGIDPTKVSFIGGSSAGQLSLLAAFNANQATPGRITMAYSLSGPVDLWKIINALQTGAADPLVDEGPPGYRNIELYLGCDWDGAAAPTCRKARAKAVSPLFIGGPTCPLVRITRSETEDMVEAQDLVARLLGRGCGTAADPRAEARLAGTEHGFGQWPLIGPSVIADLDEHMKPAPPPPAPPPGAS